MLRSNGIFFQRSEFKHIVAWGQAVKSVISVHICVSRAYQEIPGAVREIHSHTWDSGFCWVLNAVAVCIVPYKIPEACRASAPGYDHARVNCEIVLSRRKRDLSGPASHNMRITV